MSASILINKRFLLEHFIRSENLPTEIYWEILLFSGHVSVGQQSISWFCWLS